MLVLLPHIPLPASSACTPSLSGVRRMVISLNLAVIKASTGGTQEAKLATGTQSNTGAQRPAGRAEGDRSHSRQAPRT